MLGALTGMTRPMGHEIDRDLGGFIDTDTVNVQSLDRETSKHLDALGGVESPFSQTILH